MDSLASLLQASSQIKSNPRLYIDSRRPFETYVDVSSDDSSLKFDISPGKNEHPWYKDLFNLNQPSGIPVCRESLLEFASQKLTELSATYRSVEENVSYQGSLFSDIDKKSNVLYNLQTTECELIILQREDKSMTGTAELYESGDRLGTVFLVESEDVKFEELTKYAEQIDDFK